MSSDKGMVEVCPSCGKFKDERGVYVNISDVEGSENWDKVWGYCDECFKQRLHLCKTCHGRVQPLSRLSQAQLREHPERCSCDLYQQLYDLRSFNYKGKGDRDFDFSVLGSDRRDVLIMQSPEGEIIPQGDFGEEIEKLLA